MMLILRSSVTLMDLLMHYGNGNPDNPINSNQSAFDTRNSKNCNIIFVTVMIKCCWRR